MGADNQQERLPKVAEFLKWYLAGFIDGEGCFSVSIRRSKYAHLRWTINPLFQVYQHKSNSKVLFICKDVFGCGYVSKKGGNPSCFTFCVDKISDLTQKVIPFFDIYRLIGEKYQNYLLFKQIVVEIERKTHKTKDGFLYLTDLAFQMNRNGKYRKITKKEIYDSLTESSETIRQTPQIIEEMI